MNIPIDEQILFVKEFSKVNVYGAAILATLERVKAAEAGLPVEPEFFRNRRVASVLEESRLFNYIDTLRAYAAQMKAERDDALANHKAAEENVSELMAEAFAVAPVAGGNVVSATEDSLSAAGESPAFTQWAETEYGDVRPAWVSALKKAFAAGAEQAEARAAGFENELARLANGTECCERGNYLQSRYQKAEVENAALQKLLNSAENAMSKGVALHRGASENPADYCRCDSCTWLNRYLMHKTILARSANE